MSAPAAAPRLPPSIRVLERGWLSSNNVLFLEGERASLVDSGYVSHAEQTVSMLRQALEGRRLARLTIDTVIPGHGPASAEVGDALEQAFARLAAFEADGEKLARHALKVVLSFALLEKRRMAPVDLPAYLAGPSLYRGVNARYFRQSFDVLAGWLVRDLERAGAARREGDQLVAGSAA